MISEIEKEFLKESNAIEGVFDDRALQQAIKAWEYLKSQKKLNTHVLKKTHKILMLSQPGLSPKEKGNFRTIPVYIAGRKCDVLNADGWPLETVMSQWCFEANKLNSVGTAIVQHILYEKTHPFVDGNGRTGRMFLNWQNLKMGREILIIKASERQKYYEWFG
jgi:Fic family protein